MVVRVVITLSTKYAGRACIGPAVRMMACSSIVRPNKPRERRLYDDSTGRMRATAHLTLAPATLSAMARASATLAERLLVLAGPTTNHHRTPINPTTTLPAR